MLDSSFIRLNELRSERIEIASDDRLVCEEAAPITARGKGAEDERKRSCVAARDVSWELTHVVLRKLSWACKSTWQGSGFIALE